MGATDSHFGDTRALDPRSMQDVEERRERRRGRRLPVAPLLVVALLVLLIGGVAYGAYVLLPTATVSLTPNTTTLRLDPFTVTADPGTAVVDPVSGTMPAQSIAVPLHVTDTFDATGTQVSETKATGTVQFRSENTINPVTVPAGTFRGYRRRRRVRHSRGRRGADRRLCDVHAGHGQCAGACRAIGAERQRRRAHHRPGAALDLVAARVRQQPRPTTGGARNETAVITQKDYDQAVATLTGRLDNAMAVALTDPDRCRAA